MKSIINVGEVLIDLIPSPALRLREACYTPHPGGAGANVAVAIARLGGSSRFIGTVSDDEFGQLLVQELVSCQVDVSALPVVPDAPTTVVLVTLKPGGQRSFSFLRDGTADACLRTELIDWDVWNDVAICHTGGVLLSTEPARSATLAAMDYTRQQGSIVSFDVNVRLSLWESPAVLRDVLAQAITRTDILKLSTEESMYVVPQSDSIGSQPDTTQLTTLAKELLKRGPRLVIITRGEEGALLVTAKHQVVLPALPIVAVDTTGAGDAFIGAVLYQLVQQNRIAPTDLETLSEQELFQLGSFGTKVAGISSTRYGGIASYPFLHELDDFTLDRERPS